MMKNSVISDTHCHIVFAILIYSLRFQIAVPKLKHAILDMEKNLHGLESDIEDLRTKVDPNAKKKLVT